MNEELYISFENYLQGEMALEDKLNFEGQLQNDADFRTQFEAYKEVTLLLENKFSTEADSFKENLNTISEIYFAETSAKNAKVVSFKPWFYAVAASIALLIGTWFAFQNNQPLYADYSHEEANFMSRDGENAALKTAQDLFNKKEYAKAVLAFENLGKENQEINYFHAIALIETNNYSKADQLLTALQNGNSVYRDKATWYMALLALKQEKLDKCRKILEEIPPEAEDYQKAQKLLKDLD